MVMISCERLSVDHLQYVPLYQSAVQSPPPPILRSSSRTPPRTRTTSLQKGSCAPRPPDTYSINLLRPTLPPPPPPPRHHV